MPAGTFSENNACPGTNTFSGALVILQLLRSPLTEGGATRFQSLIGDLDAGLYQVCYSYILNDNLAYSL